jgi:hypothetical protein
MSTAKSTASILYQCYCCAKNTLFLQDMRLIDNYGTSEQPDEKDIIGKCCASNYYLKMRTWYDVEHKLMNHGICKDCVLSGKSRKPWLIPIKYCIGYPNAYKLIHNDDCQLIEFETTFVELFSDYTKCEYRDDCVIVTTIDENKETHIVELPRKPRCLCKLSSDQIADKTYGFDLNCTFYKSINAEDLFEELPPVQGIYSKSDGNLKIDISSSKHTDT